MSENVDEYMECDFVYCGTRLLTKNELGIEIRKIINGELAKPSFFSHNKKRDRKIGGVYRGASFSESGSKGLDDAKFDSLWHDKNMQILWEAEDRTAKAQDKCNKLEKDLKKISEIDMVMLPLRIQYETCRQRRDLAGMDALFKAVQISLRNTPRLTENIDK